MKSRLLLALTLTFASGSALAYDYTYLLPIDPVHEVGSPTAPPAIRPGAVGVVADALPAVDVNDRASVRAFYRAAWLDVVWPDIATQWTGSYAAKNPGDISATWRRLLLNRLNAYRALAGVPLIPATSSTWDAYAQEGAFALSINNVLTHDLTPDIAPAYWNRRAGLGALRSLLGAGIPAGAAGHYSDVEGFIEDYGDTNARVGHRSALLDPKATHAGIGIAPDWANWRGQKGYVAGNSDASGSAFMVSYDSIAVEAQTNATGTFPLISTRDPVPTWPNRGFFPVQLLHSARWSLASAAFDGGNDYTTATVALYMDGDERPTLVQRRDREGFVYLVDPTQAEGGRHPWTQPDTSPYYGFPVGDFPAWTGRDVRFIARVSGITDKKTGVPVPDYIYSTVIFDAKNDTPESAPLVTVPALEEGQKFVGEARQVLTDVHHPNGNVYDQLQLTGASATFSADAGQVTRLSYIDLNDDIVQVEFSGAGRVHIVLDAFSPLARPVLYNQDTEYVKGHARIYVADADATTHFATFSVGKANAVNQALFREGVAYDGVADLKLVALSSPTGRIAGLYLGNASFWGVAGYVGLHAPAVDADLIRLGDIDAREAAIPVLLTGSVAEIAITGGSLEQANGWPVFVGRADALAFGDGSTSHGLKLLKQANRAVLYRDDRNVTSALVR